jgi:O-antigen ligase
MCINNQLLKTVFFISMLICGLSAFSDAFVLSLVIAIFGYLFSKSISSTTFLILGLPALLIGLFLLFLYVYIFFNFNLLESLIVFWNEADQGGTRLSLYQNGIIAFLHSPLLGHGAGAFAGISIPFEKFEAHNTFIDLTTIGGLLLPIIFYAPLVIAYFGLIKKNPLASAILLGLIFFTLFHFVARHPIIWLVWGICFNQFILNFLSKKSPS